ncbi:MAG: hypothetical protein N2109_08755 [Fimbriimonadales bacterium]|nr:hypothetical protein [Fimbriimonadales bacterium]
MRRFNQTSIGKRIGRAALAALVIPALSAITAQRAEAQIQTNPTWAVLEFNNASGKGPENLGATAAEAFRSELGKTGRYEIIPAETVNRALITLNLQPPVTQRISLIRLGQEIGASNLVTGDILNWRVVNDGKGKRADVILRVVVTDVASGLAVNGASFVASSTVRPMDATEETLLADALAIGATQGVSEIISKDLPRGTILNTTTDQALVNQGSRSGFAVGQEVIVLRGREQVGVGIVTEVEPDSSTIKLVRTTRGLQPGDRVRVIFTPKEVSSKFTASGGVQVAKPKPRSPNSGLLTVAAVLGLALVLLGQGRASNDALVADFVAEATNEGIGGTPAIRLSWKPDLLTKGNEVRDEWQVWRDDVTTSPVLVVPGNQISAIDTADVRTLQYQNITTVGGRSCDITEQEFEDAEDVPGLVSGRPYRYQVRLIYKLLSIDVPGADTDSTYCYFASSRVSARGTATPFSVPVTISPAAGATVNNPASVTFSFQAAPTFVGTNCEYVVQISDSLLFPKNRTVTVAKFLDNKLSPATITVDGVPVTGLFAGATRLYWRVGVRNLADKPGPKPDQFTGERYVFSFGSEFLVP